MATAKCFANDMPLVRAVPTRTGKDGTAMLLTTTQAADWLGVTESLVRRYCRDGRLEATKLGRDWFIVESDLEHFAQKPRKVGRPKSQHLT